MSCCGAGGDGGVVFPAEGTYVPRFLDLRGRVGAADKSLLGVGEGGGRRSAPYGSHSVAPVASKYFGLLTAESSSALSETNPATHNSPPTPGSSAL